MTYGTFKEKVLQLIFSSTIAGENIQLTYNNQADYVKAIPNLLNSAQSYVYQVKKIPETVLVKDLETEDMGDRILIVLPEDCLQMKPGIIVPKGMPKYAFTRSKNYRLFGGNKLICPKGLDQYAMIEYWKRAVPVPHDVQDNYVLKNTEEVNEILPFYVGAFLVKYDDPFCYQALKNEFEDRLMRLTPNPVYIEENEITDVYNVGWGYD